MSKRLNHLGIRVSDEEMNDLRSKAKAQHKSCADFVRGSLFREPKPDQPTSTPSATRPSLPVFHVDDFGDDPLRAV